MGAASFLASVGRQSLLSVRHPSKLLAPAAQPLALQLDHEHDQQKQQIPAAHRLIHRFHSELTARLHHLQLHGSGSAHLNWLLDALASTVSTHSSLLSVLFTAAEGAGAGQGASSDEPASLAAAAASLAKHRADEMLGMLDVCNSFKQVAQDIDRQFTCLHRAAQNLGDALAPGKPFSSSRIRSAARKLSACGPLHQLDSSSPWSSKQYQQLAAARTSLFLAVKSDMHRPASTSSDSVATLLSQAFNGAMLTSRVVLAAALSSVLPPSPKKLSGTVAGACKIITKYLSAKRSESAEWASPLGQLHHALIRQEEMSTVGGTLYQELQGLHSAAMNVQTALSGCAVLQETELATVKQRVDSLRKSLEEAQACVKMSGIYMGSLFQALVSLRLALLDRIATC